MMAASITRRGLEPLASIAEEVRPERTSGGANWVRLPNGQIIGSKSE
jgi:hypothetical protein